MRGSILYKKHLRCYKSNPRLTPNLVAINLLILDFTSGTLATTWQASVNANRAVGQVNIGDSTSNNFLLTGVQLEVGSVATDFEHRSFAQELAL